MSSAWDKILLKRTTFQEFPVPYGPHFLSLVMTVSTSRHIPFCLGLRSTLKFCHNFLVAVLLLLQCKLVYRLGWKLHDRGSISGGIRILSILHRVQISSMRYRASDPKWVPGPLSLCKNGHSLKVTASLHLVLSLRACGASLLLLRMSSWRGA
jgi:hypothetical protein